MAGQSRAAVIPSANEVHRVISTAVDGDFYRAVYTDLPPGIGPLWHYRWQGWREARDPAPWFSAKAYLAANPDVKRLKIDPFFHYLTEGRRQAREVVPSVHAVGYFRGRDWSPPAWSHTAFDVNPPVGGARPMAMAALRVGVISRADADAAVARGFDAAFYLAVNLDVAASDMAPLQHFLVTGWLEGRDPTAGFSVRDYMEANPDVAASGLNPFAHFMIAGRAEGRAARHDLGFEFDVILRLRPVADRIASSVAASAALALDPPDILASAFLGVVGDFHITFSHDNYAEVLGGLQACVRREGAAFAKRGARHLHLYPAAPWSVVRAENEPGPLGVLLDGARIGVFEPEVVAEAVRAMPKGGRRTFAIHSLLGHAADATADIVEAAGLREGHFWTHDFASLCAGFHLQRNDVLDCGAPPADSPACGVCAYGPFRARHTGGHRRLFERLALTVVAPSQVTLDFWKAHGDLPTAAACVLPLARLAGARTAPPAPADRPLRVAFLGMPSPLKGWPVYRRLAQQFAGDPRYQFLHLGGRSDPGVAAEFHPVSATAERPTAMLDAVRALEIDAALIWPLCRETFSFTAYEAAAGGAMVITGPESGNVAAFAAGRGRGRVLADVEALHAAFASGEILQMSRARRPVRLYRMAYSGMSADLVGRPQ